MIEISQKIDNRFFLMFQGSFNPKIRFLSPKVCSVATHTDTHESENRGHPFGVSAIFPSTYHQGSVQYGRLWDCFAFKLFIKLSLWIFWHHDFGFMRTVGEGDVSLRINQWGLVMSLVFVVVQLEFRLIPTGIHKLRPLSTWGLCLL